MPQSVGVAHQLRRASLAHQHTELAASVAASQTSCCMSHGTWHVVWHTELGEVRLKPAKNHLVHRQGYVRAMNSVMVRIRGNIAAGTTQTQQSVRSTHNHTQGRCGLRVGLRPGCRANKPPCNRLSNPQGRGARSSCWCVDPQLYYGGCSPCVDPRPGHDHQWLCLSLPANWGSRACARALSASSAAFPCRC